MFSAITQPNYPSAALGIEQASMSAVSLSGGRRQFSIKQAASIDLPPGLITANFLGQNINDHHQFAGHLREVVEIAGLLNQKRWSVALPSNSARTAIIALDSEPASKKEAEEVLDWKAEQTFGAPAAEMRLAMQKISPDKDNRSRYFATAVRLAVIDEYESHFEAMGWQAGLILPRAVGEANWLIDRDDKSDSLLISGNDEGFTALLMRGSEPAVVRSVTCEQAEVSDEIYRLVMFYIDRFAGRSENSVLEKLLVIGRTLVPATVQTIASEALGRTIRVLTPDDVGLNMPGGGLKFDDLAAPAGLAALGA